MLINEELIDTPVTVDNSDAQIILDKVVKVRRRGIKHVTTKQGRHMWYYFGGRISKIEAAIHLAKLGFTIDEFIAAEKVADEYFWGVEVPRRVAVREQAKFLRDKIKRDSKPSNEPMPALYPVEDCDEDDELIDTPEVDKDATADSLTRAMTTALEHYQDFCRVKNLTSAEYELKLYNICRKAMSELWKEEAA